MKRLAIITTHPIQYYAPVFKLLHERGNISIKVFYTWGHGALKVFDPGFNQTVEWDLPLLNGYPFEWVKNTSKTPGSHTFKGIINPDIKKQVKVFNPDAVLVIGWSYQGHLKAMCYFWNKIPVLFRGDSTLLDEKTKPSSILRTVILKWIYRHVDHAFYVGKNSKAYFKRFGLKEKELTFTPHAVDNERFAALRVDETSDLRRKLGVLDGDILIVFAGKLEGKKDPLLLLHAFLKLNKPNVHLLFVGNGVLEEQLKAEASDSNNVHFIGFQNQFIMPVIYQATDLFCLPSKGPGESWGLAVNEAMACGKAVLISDKVGCAVDLVKTEENGAIFRAGNVGDLLKHLVRLTADKQLLNTFGKRSAQLIKDWNFTSIAVAIENYLLHEAH